jgi:hypothetical protein
MDTMETADVVSLRQASADKDATISHQLSIGFP